MYSSCNIAQKSSCFICVSQQVGKPFTGLLSESSCVFLSSGVFGKHCELNSYGFEELSYMEFPSLDPNNNYIYIKFATLKNNALLMYNHDNQTGDKAEFLALEIFEGRMRFSFNLGSGTYKLMTMIKVSDGQFHTVIARRAGMVRTTIFMVEISSYTKLFVSLTLENQKEKLKNPTWYGLHTGLHFQLHLYPGFLKLKAASKFGVVFFFAPSDDN